MDRTGGPSLVATQTPLRPQGTLGMARPRKRLQKPCTRQPKEVQKQQQQQQQQQQHQRQQQHQQQLPIRPTPGSQNVNPENKAASPSNPPGQAPPSRSTPQLQPPDLSDSKWADYVGKGKGDIIGTMDAVAVSKESLSVPVATFPEFAHLAPETTRASIDSCRTPVSATSSRSSMSRRRAKTPVLRIGQLESMAERPSADSADAEGRPKSQSAEAMAEEYRALLNPHSQVAPELRSQQSSPGHPTDSRRSPTSPAHPKHNLGGARREVTPPPAAVDLARCSPTSDDGTLVSFEDETIYFKPLSFTPDPESPSTPYHDRVMSQSRQSLAPAAPKSISLQICLELLTRELSSAMHNRPKRSGAEAPSLQVWVMIEAYERLRDQLRDAAGIPSDELLSIDVMLDTWLYALYKIHDSMVSETRTTVSRAELDALQSEDLD